MNNIKTTLLSICFLVLLITPLIAGAQFTPISPMVTSATIEDCYAWSKENYPLINQLSIIDKSTQYNIKNASNGNLPQIAINGQASYQSDVTQLPIEIPNMEVPTIDKDQYKIYGELYQPLTNFTRVGIQKDILKNNGELEKQKVEVDLYQLKNRINQIFFGILLIHDKNDQLAIIKSDLDSAVVKVKAAILNGVATDTDKRLLDVELLIISQQMEENMANKEAFLVMLSALTGKNISEETKLVKPQLPVISSATQRPELRVFKLQYEALELQQNQLNNSLLPSLGLFAQGGYGRPALNFLSNDFELYYIGGLKLNWNISQLYNFKNTKKTIDLNIEKIGIQQQIFLLNTNLTKSQQSAEVLKFDKLILSDKDIIQLREDVLATARVQLDNGLITTIDYIKILNDVNRARQMLILHETQLLLAQHNLSTTTGN